MRPSRLLSFVVLSILVLPLGCGDAGLPPDPDRFPVIPLPAEVELGRGEFVLDAGTQIAVNPADDSELNGVIDRWTESIRDVTGISLSVVLGNVAEDGNVIRIDVAGSPEGATAVPTGSGLPGVEAEAYGLEVNSRRTHLEARGNAGVFYGLQTLAQMVQASEAGTGFSIPAATIEDIPRFPYRGMHLDVGRHLFPVDFIKRYIDILASYKMNVFHWHLTEDQGWRLEIQKYPRLTEVGSCRAETIVEKNFNPYVGDGEEYCGFYTQAEAREIVDYARDRFITVMPEIELPGHSTAALAAYPEFACSPGPFQAATRWGVMRDIYCPKEETFDFLEDVFTEVMEIFPSQYIHIGGDEAPKYAWEQSELAQEVIRREGLADEEELQSWFIRRIEGFLNDNGRRLMGWDEILEGGLAPDATVMSWRGMAGGIEAAREGHDVVMTPTGYAYFDYYQAGTFQEPLAIGGLLTLERVYEFEPVPEELTASEAEHILGGQGNLWTEYIPTADHAEYMLLPRLLALSEVVWSPVENREWGHFTKRLPPHLGRFREQGINFRVPDVADLGGFSP